MSLGKGLGALIAPSSSRKKTTYATGEALHNNERVWLVPVTEIKPNHQQPRREFNQVELEELASSIKEHGVLQPLLVAEHDDGGYEIIAGERRWRASQLAGLTVVPVMVKALPDQQRLEVALIENIQRADLNPLEEAFAYQRLIEEFGLTQQQVAERVGKSRPAIANTIRLLDLPEAVRQALVAGTINTGQARALLSLNTDEERLQMLSSLRGEKITVRELERTVAAKLQHRPRGRRDPNLLYLEEQLRSTLGTKVNFTQKGEQGTITIYYYSNEERTEIIKKIVN